MMPQYKANTTYDNASPSRGGVNRQQAWGPQDMTGGGQSAYGSPRTALNTSRSSVMTIPVDSPDAPNGMHTARGSPQHASRFAGDPGTGMGGRAVWNNGTVPAVWNNGTSRDR